MNSPLEEIFRQRAEIYTIRLQTIFMEAIDSQNYGMLYEIARAVEAVSKRTKVHDPLRAKLLLIKEAFIKQNRQITIKEIAVAVGWPEKHSADGFSQLRKLCKDLGVPIARSRVLRKNKNPKTLKKKSEG